MKKDRNCMGNNMGAQMYPNAIPMMPIPQTFPTPYPTTYQNNYNNMEQYNTLQQQINMLDERVSKLEGKNTQNYSTKYNDSNYYML